MTTTHDYRHPGNNPRESRQARWCAPVPPWAESHRPDVCTLRAERGSPPPAEAAVGPRPLLRWAAEPLLPLPPPAPPRAGADWQLVGGGAHRLGRGGRARAYEPWGW